MLLCSGSASCMGFSTLMFVLLAVQVNGNPFPTEKNVLTIALRLIPVFLRLTAKGMNIIRAKSQEMGWDIDIGGIARIWKGGCIIRAGFLDLIKEAYVKRPELPNLLVDPFFGGELAKLDSAWRRVVCKSVTAGLPCPGFSASLGYYDSYRCEKLPANLIQAQRDYFGSHTYQRVDSVDWYHTVWSEGNSGDSITTNNY
mmetsp:Transcript_14053/g.33181  ORF Transcript_14053/g.33181 Transcript_14053/m.33181 type:complete len:199 (+) Transcript_14053:570-1166(+)